MSSYEGKEQRIARIPTLKHPITNHFTPEAMPDLQACKVQMKDLKPGVILTEEYKDEKSIQDFFSSVFRKKNFFEYCLSFLLIYKKEYINLVDIHTLYEHIFATIDYEKETVILRKDSSHGTFYMVSKADRTQKDFSKFDNLIQGYLNKQK